MKPQFPLRILSRDGTEEHAESRDELVQTLEWFDSEDGDASVQVVDALGRPVLVRIEALQLKALRLKVNQAKE